MKTLHLKTSSSVLLTTLTAVILTACGGADSASQNDAIKDANAAKAILAQIEEQAKASRLQEQLTPVSASELNAAKAGMEQNAAILMKQLSANP